MTTTTTTTTVQRGGQDVELTVDVVVTVETTSSPLTRTTGPRKVAEVTNVRHLGQQWTGYLHMREEMGIVRPFLRA